MRHEQQTYAKQWFGLSTQSAFRWLEPTDSDGAILFGCGSRPKRKSRALSSMFAGSVVSRRMARSLSRVRHLRAHYL